ncbi:dihydropteroate synthase [Actibacterium mucosum KCTC 23349]|uniref:Dihydropteroate synthase n=1 Tax=Actibacterium mucosum KCTC 23349 TaxID=1454373 RepID=A0A037ZCI8_9RHOB|nr:dihydropteroate synthase [Actibacterium mucosum]KAJ54219.1 dihydropteroate synthase [Actibacterium mucosum KCTC 23349]
MPNVYYRPIAQTDPSRPKGALPIAGGWTWFDRVERIERNGVRDIVPAADVPEPLLQRISEPRSPIAGVPKNRPGLMGILNVTPDSFSDGGRFFDPEAAIVQSNRMLAEGADILDIGGESTRPGAALVLEEDEIARTVPVIQALRQAGTRAPVSIDTRKSQVARAALAAGADLVNDVSAFSFDPNMAATVSEATAPVCLMHAQGTPDVMQDAPRYDDVLLDVYDFLAEKLCLAERAGIPRARVLVDPGIGFGKTLDHNLALLRGVSLFHSLGCSILVGASRKRFIGTITGVVTAEDRVAGSVAVALAAAAQGVQVLRVHDISETRQALTMAGKLWGTR